eukprot:GFUD01072197.1.p1 GENE.GFUD01072197.1~~GFUD01072197.1.p1  ORF type:complete len:281 (-),score=71.13 GFUD01072197.1:462-1304(-)
MGTMEILSLDIWGKFEDLLPPVSPNIVDGFEERLFEDIFNDSVFDKSTCEDETDSLGHLRQAISELNSSLHNDQQDLTFDTDDDQIFSDSLESSFSFEIVLDDSFECDIANPTLHDHSYSQRGHFNDDNNTILDENVDNISIMNEHNKEDEPINTLLTVIRTNKSQDKKEAAPKKPLTRSLLKRQLKYTTNISFNFEEREFHNYNERLRREHLKKTFEYLRKRIPLLSGKKKSSKFVILESATEYCKELFDNLVQAQEEKLKEEKENKILKEQLSILLHG